MSRKVQSGWVVLSPPFKERSEAKRAFRAHALKLSELLSTEEDSERINEALSDSLQSFGTRHLATTLQAALHVLTDLARQRWPMRINESGDPEVKHPEANQFNSSCQKEQIRAQERVKRDEQLLEPATRRFIKGMEQKSVHYGELNSIYSVFRDGRELAASLRSVRSLEGEERIDALGKVIDPYLQFVNEAEYCEHTGMRLQDIWRYFRHTWTNQYTVTPGRSMAFIIRDRAVKQHPVIGIGSLGSPIMQIRERDSWIGWQPDVFIELAKESPSEELGSWIQKTVEKAIDEIYLEDFFEEELVSLTDIRTPKPEILQRLIAFGEKQRELHHRLASVKEMKSSMKRYDIGSTAEHWQARARTHLFRSKRALQLADMLKSRIVIQNHFSKQPSGKEVCSLLNTGVGRQIVKKVLRKAKADRVGIAMADITVCGAVAPYNIVLGGNSYRCLQRALKSWPPTARNISHKKAKSLPQWQDAPLLDDRNLCSWGQLLSMALAPANTTD